LNHKNTLDEKWRDTEKTIRESIGHKRARRYLCSKAGLEISVMGIEGRESEYFEPERMFVGNKVIP
jgi:hypothetical protein